MRLPAGLTPRPLVSPQAKTARRTGTAAPAAEEAFALFADAAQRAHARVGGAVERDLLLAGAALRLRFAGHAVADLLMPALGHAAVPADGPSPDVTIDVWDSATTSVAAPELPLNVRDVRERGAIPRYSDERFETLFHGDLLAPHGDFRAVSTFDRAKRRGVLWVLSPERVPWWERAAPMRTLLHWALTGESRLLVHAAAVGRAGCGVLIAGASGSGKSTTAAACLEAGMECAGDDYVLLEVSEDAVAHPLYGTVKLGADSLALLPGLPHGDPPGEGEKFVLDLAQRWPHTMAKPVSIGAIVVPRPATNGGGAKLRPASGALALRALAPTTIFQLAGDNGGALRPLAGLARRLPTYELELGSRPIECACLLDGLVGGLGR
jgi:hypothetical protein